ncbi:MAG: acylphosphatase [Pseudomonadota bacterium]
MSDTIRRRVVVSGLVQGVAFRYYARDAAREAGARGWVRNLPDGRVEAVLEGDHEAVNSLVKWFHSGSPASRVEMVRVIEEAPTGEFSDFDITFARGDMW